MGKKISDLTLKELLIHQNVAEQKLKLIKEALAEKSQLVLENLKKNGVERVKGGGVLAEVKISRVFNKKTALEDVENIDKKYLKTITDINVALLKKEDKEIWEKYLTATEKIKFTILDEEKE